MGKKHGRKEGKPAKPVIKLFKNIVSKLLENQPSEALALLHENVEYTKQVLQFEDEHSLSITHHAVQAMLSKQPDQRTDYVDLIEALYQTFSYQESGDSTGITPLMHLCKDRDGGLLAKLVPHMRPLQSWQQQTITKHLIDHHHTGPLKALLDSVSPDQRRAIICPQAPISHPLLHAAQMQHVDQVTLLLEYGADPLCTDQFQNTPLMKALIYSEDQPACVNALLPYIKDERKHRPMQTGGSLFHMACELGYTNIVGCLLDHGVDPNQVDISGELPIHTAITFGWPTITQQLLPVTTNLDTPSPKGWSLLHYSVFYKHAKITEILLKNFFKSVTTVMMTQSNQQKVVVQPLVYAVRNFDIPNTKILAQYGMDLDLCFDKSIQACHWRYQGPNTPSLLDTAGTLHTNPAYSPAGCLADWTVLHEACAHNRHPIVDILLQHGASFHHTTDNGITALMLAIACYDNNSKTVQALLAKGADPNAITTDGRATPLTLAIRKNAPDLVHLLLAHKANPEQMVCSTISPLALAYQLEQDSCLALLLNCSLETRDFIQSQLGTIGEKIASISPKQVPELDPNTTTCDRVLLLDAYLKATQSSVEDVQSVILFTSTALPQIPNPLFLKHWDTLKEVFVAKLSQYYTQCQLYQAIQAQSFDQNKSALNPDSLFVQLYTVDHPLISKILGCSFLTNFPQDSHWPKRLFNRLLLEALYSSIITVLKQHNFTQLAQNLDHAEHNQYTKLQSYWLAVLASYPTPPYMPDQPTLTAVLTEVFWDKLINLKTFSTQSSQTTAVIISRYAWYALLANHAPNCGILGKICEKQQDLFISFRSEYEKKLDSEALASLPHMPKLEPHLSIAENCALQSKALLHSLCVTLPQLIALSQDPNLGDVRTLAKVPFYLIQHFPERIDKITLLNKILENFETQASLLLECPDIQCAILECLSAILSYRSLYSHAKEADTLRACLGKIESCMEGFHLLTHAQKICLAGYCLHKDIPALSPSTQTLLKTFYHAHHYIRTGISQQMTLDNDQSNKAVQEMLHKYQSLLHQTQEKELNQQEFNTLRQAHTKHIEKMKQTHQKELDELKTQTQKKLEDFDQEFQQKCSRSQAHMLEQSERLVEIEKETITQQKTIKNLEHSNNSLRANQKTAHKTVTDLKKTLDNNKKIHQSQVDQLRGNINKLTNQASQMDLHNATLASQLEAQTKLLTQQSDELTQSRRDYDTLQQAYKKLHTQLHDIPTREKLQGDLAAMQAKLTSQCTAMDTQNASLEREKQALADQRKALDIEKQAFTDRIEALDVEKQAFIDRIEALDAEKKASTQQMTELHTTLSKLQHDYEALLAANSHSQQTSPEGDTTSISSLSSDRTQDAHDEASNKKPQSPKLSALRSASLLSLKESIFQLLSLTPQKAASTTYAHSSSTLSSDTGLFSPYLSNTLRTLHLTVHSLETERLLYTGLEAPIGLRQQLPQIHSVLAALSHALQQQDHELGLCGSYAAHWLFNLLQHDFSDSTSGHDVDLYVSASSQQYAAIRAAVDMAVQTWQHVSGINLDYTNARHSRLVTIHFPWLKVDIHFFPNNKPLQVTDTRFCWHSDSQCFSLPQSGLSLEHNNLYLGLACSLPSEKTRRPSLFRALCFGTDLYHRFQKVQKNPRSLMQLIALTLQEKIHHNQQSTLLQDCVSLLERTMHTPQAPYAWLLLTQPFGDDNKTLLQLALSRDVVVDQYDIDYFQSSVVPMQASNLHKICVLLLALVQQNHDGAKRKIHRPSFTCASAPDSTITINLGTSPNFSGLDLETAQSVYHSLCQWQDVRAQYQFDGQKKSHFFQSFTDSDHRPSSPRTGLYPR